MGVMARTIQEIFDSMKAEGIRLATAQSNAAMLAMYNNTSAVAAWKLMYYTKAFAVWTLEKIMDAYLVAVTKKIDEEYAHTLKWYRTKALAFQYGFDLIADTDKFDNTGKTDDEVAASKIVKYAAVNETTIDNKRVLLLKVATIINDDLAPLSDTQLAAFTAYMQEVKDAGVVIIIYNREADLLRATVQFDYNPLLLDGSGNRLDGNGSAPVPAASLSYLLNLPFNGEISLAKYIDALQVAYGNSDGNVFLISMQRKVGDDWISIDNTFIPDAGYARFDTGALTINYVPRVEG